ncbi:hypothetical protein LIA77_08667 [Sarocladium implicatum]|nr:hypothetical protein LIA77_08667 [Sarocladium implicatum]
MSTPSPEFKPMVEQIQQSASAVWSGPGRSFEVRVLRSSSVTGEETMSGFYATEEEAIGDVDRQLQYMVEEQRELEALAA